MVSTQAKAMQISPEAEHSQFCNVIEHFEVIPHIIMPLHFSVLGNTTLAQSRPKQKSDARTSNDTVMASNAVCSC